MIYDVKEKASRRDRDLMAMEYSEEILTLSQHIADLNSKKQSLQSDNVQLQNRDSSSDIIALRTKDDE